MKKPSEKEIENQILKVLNLYGMFFWKNNSTGVFDPSKKVFRRSRNRFAINGVADILGIIDGRMVAIEVKRPGCKATEDQSEFIERLNDEGGLAFVTTSLEHCLDIINDEFGLRLNV